ncbi:MAG: hypothetical protein GWN81_02380 [Phycisphaerae bacterium]|nr:hypothetical protein [Phycisphaerae bacterium]NIU07717.1 hypothetical protein [Phycisphaerae bacterium]
MTNPKNRDWFQISGLLGVIAGLVLVAYEAHQANKFAEAEAIRGAGQQFRDIQVESFAGDIFEIYVKSFENPADLTDAELLRLDSWLTLMVSYWNGRVIMEKRGLMAPGAVQRFDALYDYMFGNASSVAWYSRNRGWLEPELVEIIDRRIIDPPSRSKAPLVEVLRSAIDDIGN